MAPTHPKGYSECLREGPSVGTTSESPLLVKDVPGSRQDETIKSFAWRPAELAEPSTTPNENHHLVLQKQGSRGQRSKPFAPILTFVKGGWNIYLLRNTHHSKGLP